MPPRHKAAEQKDDILPLEGLQLADDAAVEPPVQPTPTQSLAELAAAVALQRQQNIARAVAANEPLAPADRSEYAHPRRGGAFGGALKRRIERTDSAAKLAATNEHDIGLITATNLRKELFPDRRGDLDYAGVLFTPGEYGAITISPAEVSRRIGARVLAGTQDRPATERFHRRDEVIRNDLIRRQLRSLLEQARLEGEIEQLGVLRKEMRTPGYSHMPMDAIDELMHGAERVYVNMFEAIIANHRLPTERTASLTAAMEYLVSADAYRDTFKFWQQMSGLALSWDEAKRRQFTQIEASITSELSRTS